MQEIERLHELEGVESDEELWDGLSNAIVVLYDPVHCSWHVLHDEVDVFFVLSTGKHQEDKG